MPIVDLHCDTITELKKQGKVLRSNDLNLDLERMHELDIVLQDFAIFVRMTEHENIDAAWKYTLGVCDFFSEQMQANANLVSHVLSYADIKKNICDKKISALLSVEEGGVCGEQIERLEELYKRGVRLMTISWNFENTLCYPHSLTEDTSTKHLKPFGREVVQRMNEMGMIVDVSHLSDGGFWDVAALAKKPFIASHSDARAIEGHSRNLTDSMIKCLAETGGVTGINFFSKFLGHDGTGSIEQILQHIDHIKNVGGIDVLALGSDFDGFGGESGVRTCEDFPKLIRALEKAGYTNEEIDKITYKNALRVLQEVLK
ncbi:MAG: dipeptidase [Acidaminococcaceae bacterium]|nr:dipeptidase [Acidaminococcaceae bacterium]